MLVLFCVFSKINSNECFKPISFRFGWPAALVKNIILNRTCSFGMWTTLLWTFYWCVALRNKMFYFQCTKKITYTYIAKLVKNRYVPTRCLKKLKFSNGKTYFIFIFQILNKRAVCSYPSINLIQIIMYK